MTKANLTRRGVLKTGAVAGAGLALPTIFTGARRRPSPTSRPAAP